MYRPVLSFFLSSTIIPSRHFVYRMANVSKMPTMYEEGNGEKTSQDETFDDETYLKR